MSNLFCTEIHEQGDCCGGAAFEYGQHHSRAFDVEWGWRRGSSIEAIELSVAMTREFAESRLLGELPYDGIVGVVMNFSVN